MCVYAYSWVFINIDIKVYVYTIVVSNSYNKNQHFFFLVNRNRTHKLLICSLFDIVLGVNRLQVDFAWSFLICVCMFTMACM